MKARKVSDDSVNLARNRPVTTRAAARRRYQRVADARKRLAPTDASKRRRGAPAVLTEPARYMAMHYWLLKAGGKKHGVAKHVARAWGVTERLVIKHAGGPLRQEAKAFVANWLTEPTRPPWALELIITTVADGYASEGTAQR